MRFGLLVLIAVLAASLSGCVVVPPRAGVVIQPYGGIYGGWYRWHGGNGGDRDGR
ncbi:hypothetical protein GALL_343270 [mine drainage metagenome]|uniref:Lipoprotein n=1 Tax=mine drainage metagenome TaxID=410659 RepID=A0A1J5R6U6_9ZZZZ